MYVTEIECEVVQHIVLHFARYGVLVRFRAASTFCRKAVRQLEVFDALKMTPITVVNDHVHVIR